MEKTRSLDTALYVKIFIKELCVIAKRENNGNSSNSPNYKSISKSWYIYMLAYYVIMFNSDWENFLMT